MVSNLGRFPTYASLAFQAPGPGNKTFLVVFPPGWEASLVSVPAQVLPTNAGQHSRTPSRGYRDLLGGLWGRPHKPIPSFHRLLPNRPGVTLLSSPKALGPASPRQPRLAHGPPTPSLTKLQAFSGPASTPSLGRVSPRVRGAFIHARVFSACSRTISPRVSSSFDVWGSLGSCPAAHHRSQYWYVVSLSSPS